MGFYYRVPFSLLVLDGEREIRKVARLTVPHGVLCMVEKFE